MLTASGELDQRLGGPYVPTDRTDTGDVVVAEGTPGARRRSVYLQQKRTQTDSLLEVFDVPSIVTTCTRRSPSTIPLQSLSLLNSGFITTRARMLAARLESEVGCGTTGPGDPDSRIKRAFLLTFNRPPVPDEENAARRFLKSQRLLYVKDTKRNPDHQAWADLCQMLFASNAFLYVD